MAKLLRLLLPLLILGLGYLGYRQLADEETQEARPRRERDPVEVVAQLLERQDYPVTLVSEGLVQPHNETTLTSRVGGRIIRIAPEFESGSFFSEDTVLLELDTADFEAAVISAEAGLARAEASLAQEVARAEQAELDWRDLGYEDDPTDLVLRKPQMKEAQANVKAARAQLSDTERDLERTRIRAPYAGRVIRRNVGLGQSISPNTDLGQIFSTDFAEVRLSLSSRELPYVTLPNNPGDPPVPIQLTDALSSRDPHQWSGRIVRTEGALDARSRKLFIIARVDDPFGLQTPSGNPLRIGQPVRATIHGSTIENSFVIPRSALTRPTEITLVHPQDFTLLRHPIDPVWGDPDNVIVSADLPENWFLITQRIRNLPNGSKVKILPPTSDGTENQIPGQASAQAPQL